MCDNCGAELPEIDGMQDEVIVHDQQQAHIDEMIAALKQKKG
jgi:hypothetical protein